MTRLYDWRSRFHAVIESTMREPFVWGSQDCAIGLAARTVEAITGKDLAAPYRGKYTSAEGALAALKAEGFDDLPALVESYFEEIHPSQARNGDIAIIPSQPTGWTTGVFTGERIGVLTMTGYGTLDRNEAVRAFKVE